MKPENKRICFRVVANPPATVRWFFEDKPLQESGLIRMIQDCFPAMPTEESTCCVRSVLATYSHNGVYTLMAENALGRANGSMDARFTQPADLGLERGRTHRFPFHVPGLKGGNHFYEHPSSSPSKPMMDLLWVYEVRKRTTRIQLVEEFDRKVDLPIGIIITIIVHHSVDTVYGLEVMQMKREYVQLRRLRADLQCDWDDKNATSIATTDPSHLPLVEIPLHALELKQILGKGNFGEVYFAIYNFIPEEGNDPESCKVAVKFPKEGNSEEHKQDIYREAQMLAKMRHPNIIRLLGIVRSQTIGIVSEFMALGDLNGLLRKLGPKSKHFGVESGSEPQLGKLGLEDLVHVAIQVGSGLKYLTDRHFVHRDLATRNCFVGENLTVKIGDFGLSRDVYSSDYYRVRVLVI
ncbi:unnamed protein product [Darwinula stevensoni]|uniref:receptor protein-tyrosine kinase n=1 Tax=Darwinula stevensoni TaxID=69355 RepID=A0A7R9AFI8_9CRUS|nr:unnamed protein product [Darwinula stevensoni]CAG0903006.1 unnamed protein product [Darwinula stevensoni]